MCRWRLMLNEHINLGCFTASRWWRRSPVTTAAGSLPTAPLPKPLLLFLLLLSLRFGATVGPLLASGCDSFQFNAILTDCLLVERMVTSSCRWEPLWTLTSEPRVHIRPDGSKRQNSARPLEAPERRGPAVNEELTQNSMLKLYIQGVPIKCLHFFFRQD